MKQIKLSEVKQLLLDGYARYRKDDTGMGSIQEKYELSFSECKKLFAHPALKGIKSRKITFQVLDDLSEPTTSSATTNDSRVEPTVRATSRSTRAEAPTEPVPAPTVIAQEPTNPLDGLFN